MAVELLRKFHFDLVPGQEIHGIRRDRIGISYRMDLLSRMAGFSGKKLPHWLGYGFRNPLRISGCVGGHTPSIHGGLSPWLFE